jgi:hypothetical protein
MHDKVFTSNREDSIKKFKAVCKSMYAIDPTQQKTSQHLETEGHVSLLYVSLGLLS